MQEGNFLRFIPPKLSGGEIGNKSRYMLVVEYNKKIEINSIFLHVYVINFSAFW